MQGGLNPQSKEDLSKDTGTLRALIAVVVIAIIIGVLYYVGIPGAVNNDTETQQNNEQNNEQVQDGTATLSVVTDKSSYIAGEEILMQIVLDTDKEVSGVDIVLSYNDHIEILETTQPSEKISNQVAAAYLKTTQSGFTTFPYAKFDEKGGKKTLSFSGITAARQTITGEAVVAEVTAEAKTPGETSIDIAFEGRGVSTDANVAYDGRDILTSVESAFITITE